MKVICEAKVYLLLPVNEGFGCFLKNILLKCLHLTKRIITFVQISENHILERKITIKSVPGIPPPSSQVRFYAGFSANFPGLKVLTVHYPIVLWGL